MFSKSFSLDMTLGLPVSLRLAEPQRLPPRVELYRCRVASPACAFLRVDSAGTLACRAAATVAPLMYSGVTRGRPRSSPCTPNGILRRSDTGRPCRRTPHSGLRPTPPQPRLSLFLQPLPPCPQRIGQSE